MSKLFVSDLHLEASRPDIADIFFRFLKHHTKNAQALYILGDFFEAWIGDDDLSPFHMKVINALHEASDRGLRIYFMHGNRDFLLGRKFLRATGSYLLDDETVISIMGEPTLLMHGDTLCTQDTAYLKWRKKSRNWFMQKLFLWKSLEKRRQVAEDMRAKSKAYTSTAAENIMDVTQEEVERVMRKYQVRHLIHGHTHRPAVHTFELDGKTAKRTVLAPWHDEGSVLICDDLGKQEIIKLS